MLDYKTFKIVLETDKDFRVERIFKKGNPRYRIFWRRKQVDFLGPYQLTYKTIWRLRRNAWIWRNWRWQDQEIYGDTAEYEAQKKAEENMHDYFKQLGKEEFRRILYDTKYYT